MPLSTINGRFPSPQKANGDLSEQANLTDYLNPTNPSDIQKFWVSERSAISANDRTVSASEAIAQFERVWNGGK